MTKKQNPEPDDEAQAERFIETARQLEVEENEEAFEKVINVIIPPQKKPEK